MPANCIAFDGAIKYEYIHCFFLCMHFIVLECYDFFFLREKDGEKERKKERRRECDGLGETRNEVSFLFRKPYTKINPF